jgi:hypothetical protein
MTQRDLDCAVASATGEDLFEIRRRGFSIVDPSARFDPEPDLRPHQILDWDRIELHRNVSLMDGLGPRA